MSYDFHLVQKSAGADVLATARALLEQDIDEINPGPAVPEKEANKKRLAAALVRENPRLQPFQFGYAEIATQGGFSEDEVRIRYRHIELNGPNDGNGIQITIYDDTADITVPYWHQPVQAAVVFEEIWSYLRILEREGGFAVYDPQLDRLLDLETDLPTVVETYGKVLARMPEIVANAESRARPWWRFW